ncbi:MAG: redoxin family protein [Deltaproteobacteria bacterium]|nr:redoxin family protein [Deltaproteobacteria bacterium]
MGMLSRFRTAYRERRAVRWTVDLLVMLVVVVAISAWQTRKHLRDVPLPALQLRSVSGESVSLQSLRGKKTLLYLWAPWCGVCKVESPNVGHVRSLLGDRVNVVSVVAAYQSVDEVRRYVSDKGVEYPVLLGDDSIERAFKVNAFPTVYFIDEQGRIKGSATGYTTTIGLIARLYL